MVSLHLTIMLRGTYCGPFEPRNGLPEMFYLHRTDLPRMIHAICVFAALQVFPTVFQWCETLVLRSSTNMASRSQFREAHQR